LRNSIEEFGVILVFVGDSYQLPPVNENISYALRIPNRYVLTEIIRHDNSIVQAGEYCRQCIKTGDKVDINRILSFEDIIHKKAGDFYDSLLGQLKAKNNVLFVGWTNRCVNFTAQDVRVGLGFDEEKLCVGESITLNNPFVKRNTVLIPNNSPATISDTKKGMVEGIPLQKIYCGGRKDYFYSGLDLSDFNDKLSYMAVNARIDGSWRNYYSVKEKVIPVGFSHSCTVHKSQGSTVDEVFVDIGDIAMSDISARLLYVAITRTSNKAIVRF